MDKRAFTLVEVMVGILLTGLVGGAGYQIWSAARRDVALASTRQTLQNEVRKSLDIMGKDFQAMKAGTLNVTAGSSENSATIKFERFPMKPEGTSLSVENTESVIYRFNKPRLTRMLKNQGEHTLAWHLDTLRLSRGGNVANPTATTMNGVPADESGLNARMDIQMDGSSRVPGTNKIASFTEQISVFMREEYYASVNKSRFIAMSKLAGTDTANLLDEAADNTMLTLGLLDPEALAKLSREQLNELYNKEISALNETNKQLDQLNGNIGDLDTNTTGHLSWNPYNWVGHGTDITSLQNDIKNHEKSSDLASDVEKLDVKINLYEGKNLEDTFKTKVPGFSSMDKNSQQNKNLKEVYELMVRDRNMKKAHELAQKDTPEAEKKPYKSLFDEQNSASMVKGQLAGDPPVTFNETQEQFEARKAKAEMISQNKDKCDLAWMDTNEGEDRVKIYSAAKDLKDLAETKKAYAESRETHEKNIKNIQTAQAKAK